MLRSLDQVPRHLRSRVELKVMDVTSFAAALIESIDRAVDGSSSASEAFQRLGLILDELSAGDPVQLPPSDLVVSSLLLSEIPRYPFSYAAQAVETRFGAAIRTWDRSDEFFRSLVALAVEDHVRLLASLVEPEGVIYFSDTVAKGLVRRPQGEAVRRSVEAGPFRTSLSSDSPARRRKLRRQWTDSAEPSIPPPPNRQPSNGFSPVPGTPAPSYSSPCCPSADCGTGPPSWASS